MNSGYNPEWAKTAQQVPNNAPQGQQIENQPPPQRYQDKLESNVGRTNFPDNEATQELLQLQRNVIIYFQKVYPEVTASIAKLTELQSQLVEEFRRADAIIGEMKMHLKGTPPSVYLNDESAGLMDKFNEVYTNINTSVKSMSDSANKISDTINENISIDGNTQFKN